MRANVNIARKARQTLALENFKGVDLSSSPLRVSTQRATYMRNMVSENGANHKRPGWRQLFALDGKINGIFPFTEIGESGICEVLLVHAGTGLYRVEQKEGTWESVPLYAALPDTPMQCFYRDERAYLVGHGAFVAYGEFDGAYAAKDASEIAYVPTTSINLIKDMGGSTLDAVNLLTPWRKNTVVPHVYGAPLDGIPDADSDVTVTAEIWCGSGSEYYYGTVVFKGKPLSNEYGRYDYYDEDKFLPIWKSDITHVAKGSSGDFTEKKVDSFEGMPRIRVDIKGNVFFNYATINEKNDPATVEVTFRVAEDHSDKIKNCTVAATFGVDGDNNRLFLSGNPDEKGLDRWSEADDFTYFIDGNAMFVGGGEAAVTGYARLSDNTMAIFKEEIPGHPTIFYRTGAKTTMTDADGDTVYREYFPVTAGVIGMGIKAPRAGANLDGDSLIVTETGVWGVELSENVSSGERYAKERSRAIRAALLKKDLSAAVATTYKGRYYLCVEETLFVADGRHRASFEGTPDVGYEWWVWDGVPAVCFSRVNGLLAFGTADGRVCVFEEGRFCDSSFLSVREGDMLGGADGRVSYGAVPVHEGDVLEIDGQGRFTVTALDEAAQSFALCDAQGDAVAAPTGLFTGVLYHDEVVVAEWVGPVMDLGTSTARKTLLSLGVVLEPDASGPVEIALKTREDEQGIRIQNERGLDLSALDLADVSFTGSFAASHVRRMNLRNFNFIQLQMRSTERADMAVSGVTLEYKVNQTNRGYY